MIDPLIGGALITGGAGLIGGLIGMNNADKSGKYMLQAQREANQTNIQLAHEQQAWNERMWNMQNEYNTPAQQMARINEAGLNKNLMYGQGSPGLAGSVSSYQRPNVIPEDGQAAAIMKKGEIAMDVTRGITNNLVDLYMKNEQLKQMEAQTKLLQVKATKESNTTPSLDMFNKMFNYRTGLYGSQWNLNDSRTTYQDIYNMYAPGILGNQTRHGELLNTKLNQDMAIAAVDLGLRMTMTKIKTYLAPAQKMALIAGAQNAFARTNALNTMLPFQVLGSVQDSIMKGYKASILKKQDQSFWFQLIYNDLLQLSKEGRGWLDSSAKLTDAIVPF